MTHAVTDMTHPASSHLPPIPAVGRRPFDDREVKELLTLVSRVATFPLRDRAIRTLQLSAPMRPDEVRRILRSDFRERDRKARGHIVIRASKTEAGTDRLIPLDEEAETALRNYLRFERPHWKGEGPADLEGKESRSS